MIITPTVGRVVWVHRWASLDTSQPEAALVTYVHDDRLINVCGFDANGHPFQLTSLVLVQADDPKPEEYAEWMPYQKGITSLTP
jgi:hypothetical protein